MNYYIALINKYGEDWALITSTNFDYIKRVFDDMWPPHDCAVELRATDEPLDTHLDYEILARTEN